MNLKKTTAIAFALVASATLLSACDSPTPADVTSQNLSKDADNFKINRRIVFFNGITDKYLLTIEGKCSISPDANGKKLDVTCKVSDTEYKKHFLGLSDNVSYFVEQLDPATESSYNYKVIFRPETLLPDIKLDTSK